MADKPKIAGRKPAVLDLEPGQYAYCTCGLSARQPHCDGSHRGTSFKPVKFVLEEAKPKAAMCMCKQTGTPPWCDGSHRDLPDEG